MTEASKQWEGQVVNGEFRLLQYLGGSEHSAVFLTEHGEGKQQKAAIKLILADDPANVEHQLARWRLAQKLSHPNLIRLFQMGRCQVAGTNLVYIVMEYAEEALSQILPQRPLTPAEARDLLGPALGALSYLHGRGFVHGHIKPANILAAGDELKLSSDGVCRADEPSGALWKPSDYDPPEARDGKMSPAGDVWSLGITLVEILTQRPPGQQSVEQGKWVLPQTVPALFHDLVRHCLQRDPQRRWTVADTAARIEQPRPLSQEPTKARPHQGRIKWQYVLPAAVVLVLVAILAGPRLFNPRPQARQTSDASEQPKTQPRSEEKIATPETRQSRQRSGRERASSSDVAPSTAPLRSVAVPNSTSGLVRGEVLQQVLPKVPQKASDTIQGTIRVRVKVTVDPSGSVVGATLDSSGPSKYFADLALQAARGWEFAPAKVDGRSVSSEWILRFEFQKNATKVFPVEVAP